MAKDYTTIPINEARRKDRAIEDSQWIIDFLHRAPFGCFGFSLDGQPFINSNIFVYDEKKHAIYFHTAREGHTRSIMSKNSKACFSISEMGRLLPAKEALEMSVEYKGIAIFGEASVVEDEAEAYPAFQLLLDKYFPHLEAGRDYRATTPEEWNRTSLFRLDIASWSGKQKKADADFPGAFLYNEVASFNR
jgi:nitroimidazol reductase NimA-like FMN-containing flavoprotein (pyridoxamine 5'-phosphate oxidase superfamily)